MSKKTTEEFIAQAKNIHGNKYDYSKSEYMHSKEKLIIICPKHGEFLMKPNNHLMGQGCPKCNSKKKLTEEEFIFLSKLRHGNKYGYSKVQFVNTKTKVTVTCPKHGDFEIIPSHHMNGSGCKKCHFENLSNLYSLSEEKFLQKANEIHDFKYSYGEYNGYNKKMSIICPIHGEFKQTPHTHLSGGGCKKCSNERQQNEKAKSFEDFVKEANQIHDCKYTYIPPYVNKDTLIEIICPMHGSFRQMPKIHLKGCGCPKCKSSHLEKRILKLLTENNLEFIYGCNKRTLDWLGMQHLDFYLPQHNIAIECQGEQHFVPSNFGSKDKDPNVCLSLVKERDERKRKLCEEHNVKLLYFSDKQWKENIITDENNLLREIK